MSWGKKIAILYLGFVALIITMVDMSSRQKVDLVSKDYYEQELRFQERLDKSSRSNALSEPLTWKIESGRMLLNFPAEFKGKKINGSVYFYRPSDQGLDVTLPVPAGGELVRTINTGSLVKGIYKIELSWEVDGVNYYNEGIVTIN